MSKCQTIERFGIQDPSSQTEQDRRSRKQNLLAQRQSEAHENSKLYSTIAGIPGDLNSKCIWNCLARILSRSWRKGTASRQVSKLQGYGNCGKTKTSQDEARLEAGLKASLWSLGGSLKIRTRKIFFIPEASLDSRQTSKQASKLTGAAKLEHKMSRQASKQVSRGSAT